MVRINPWINFNGNAKEVFDFYKSVFGGDFAKVMRFEGSDKIMQIGLPIGNTILITNDVLENMGQVYQNKNRSKISVNVESHAEADRLFTVLSAGGSIEEPMVDSSWGSYFSMFR